MTRNGQRLLMLVNDDSAQRRIVAAQASRGGWRTIFAGDAEMALATLGTQDGMQLDAIVLDRQDDWAAASDLIAELQETAPRCRS